MASPKEHGSYSRHQNNINSQLKDISKNLEAYLLLIQEGAKEGIDEIAKEIHDRSLEIVPVDTGELKDSIYIANVLNDNKEYIVEVGYTADHAVFAHENPRTGKDYMNPTTPGTHWQFLLSPASEIENEIANKIAEKIKSKL